jgi:hypothetical protein
MFIEPLPLFSLGSHPISITLAKKKNKDAILFFGIIIFPLFPII